MLGLCWCVCVCVLYFIYIASLCFTFYVVRVCMHSLLSSSVVISTTLGFNLREVDQESKGLNHFGTVCVCVCKQLNIFLRI